GYNLLYYKPLFDETFSHNLNFSGELNLTPKWKIRGSTNYDISRAEFFFFLLVLYRDLHCWEMAFEWIPFGYNKSYYFTLKIKAPSLQDLKLDKRGDFLDNF
nr:LPS-assembly protein LptD [Bacteroidota bacterium]